MHACTHTHPPPHTHTHTLNPESWYLDLKNDNGSVEACDDSAEADVIFTTNPEVLVGMFTGKVSATSAFMSGDLKIKGDIVKAMALEKLMGQVQSKL